MSATLKQKRWIEKIVSGKNQTEATMEAYGIKDRSVARSMGSQIKRSKNIQKLMSKRGISEVDIIQEVNNALHANKVMIDKRNEDRIYPDYYIRLKTAELCLKLLGYLDKDENNKNTIPDNIKVQFINVTAWHKLKSNKKSDNIISAKVVK